MSNKSLDGVLTKKAHTREKFSEEQIQDLVECSNTKTGFEYFARKFFYIQHPVEGMHYILQKVTNFKTPIRSKFQLI